MAVAIEKTLPRNYSEKPTAGTESYMKRVAMIQGWETLLNNSIDSLSASDRNIASGIWHLAAQQLASDRERFILQDLKELFPSRSTNAISTDDIAQRVSFMTDVYSIAPEELYKLCDFFVSSGLKPDLPEENMRYFPRSRGCRAFWDIEVPYFMTIRISEGKKGLSIQCSSVGKAQAESIAFPVEGIKQQFSNDATTTLELDVITLSNRDFEHEIHEHPMIMTMIKDLLTSRISWYLMNEESFTDARYRAFSNSRRSDPTIIADDLYRYIKEDYLKLFLPKKVYLAFLHADDARDSDALFANITLQQIEHIIFNKNSWHDKPKDHQQLRRKAIKLLREIGCTFHRGVFTNYLDMSSRLFKSKLLQKKVSTILEKLNRSSTVEEHFITDHLERNISHVYWSLNLSLMHRALQIARGAYQYGDDENPFAISKLLAAEAET